MNGSGTISSRYMADPFPMALLCNCVWPATSVDCLLPDTVGLHRLPQEEHGKDSNLSTTLTSTGQQLSTSP